MVVAEEDEEEFKALTRVMHRRGRIGLRVGRDSPHVFHEKISRRDSEGRLPIGALSPFGWMGESQAFWSPSIPWLKLISQRLTSIEPIREGISFRFRRNRLEVEGAFKTDIDGNLKEFRAAIKCDVVCHVDLEKPWDLGAAGLLQAV